MSDQSVHAIDEFLHFLARDIAARPHALRALDGTLQLRLQSLIGNIEVDLDAPLTAE
ncbi:MAG: type II toxin-antitoxin system PrlF family antitoxin [Pseudomonadota bacterium]